MFRFLKKLFLFALLGLLLAGAIFYKYPLRTAYFLAGAAYHDGILVASDERRALEMFRKSAEYGHRGAIIDIGVYYEEGRGGLKPDIPEAIRWYKQAVDLGWPMAAHNIGLIHYKGLSGKTDYDEAYRWFLIAAKDNVGQSEFQLGVMCLKGRGGCSDPNAGVAWLERAVTHGNREAQRELGKIFLFGTEGFDANTVRGRDLLQRSALAGDTDAALLLGQAYRGEGLEINLHEAARWYEEGAKNGDSRAQYNLGLMYAKGEGVRQDWNMARRWIQAAAEKSHVDAMIWMGQAFHEGYGVPRDYKEAYRWSKQAAAQGAPEAYTRMGWLYAHGEGVARDMGTALEWYKKAVEGGRGDAAYNLGTIYKNGESVPVDLAEAQRWYRRGAELNYADAMADYAVLLYNEGGQPDSEAVAYGWFKLSVVTGGMSPDRTAEVLRVIRHVESRLSGDALARGDLYCESRYQRRCVLPAVSSK